MMKDKQMREQNYKDHIRYYPPHHFVFYPVMLFLIGTCAYLAWDDGPLRMVYLILAALAFAITWLSFMLRQHYALGNQNRIVRLEMRLRYYQLTHERLEQYEGRLSFGQIAALRFASDGELPGLLQKALNEQLSPDAIKRSIKDWQADHMRA
jgi:uncharacterized protein HemX